MSSGSPEEGFLYALGASLNPRENEEQIPVHFPEIQLSDVRAFVERLLSEESDSYYGTVTKMYLSRCRKKKRADTSVQHLVEEARRVAKRIVDGWKEALLCNKPMSGLLPEYNSDADEYLGDAFWEPLVEKAKVIDKKKEKLPKPTEEEYFRRLDGAAFD